MAVNLPMAKEDTPANAPTQLPSVDDLLGAPKQGGENLPTADDLLGKGPDWGFQGSVMSGAGWDQYVQQAPLGRLLNAFGQGAAQGWGTSSLGFSPETEDWLKKVGIFNDVTQGQHSIIRSINEGVMRPAAALADAAWRAGGALFGGAQRAVEAAGAEVGAPNLGREIAAIPEAFGGSPEFAGIPHAPTPPEINAFKVGQNDAVFFGTQEPTPLSAEATADLVHHQQEEAANNNALGSVPSTYAPGALGPQPTEAPMQPRAEPLPPPADVHEAARRIAPQTFNDYDNLSSQQEDLRGRIADAQADLQRNAEAQAPGQDRIAELQSRLESGTTARLAKKYQAEMDDLIPKRDEFLDSDQFAMLTRPTAEIDRMRDELQRLDYRMRDLAPDVTAAYREAAQQFPETQEEQAPPIGSAAQPQSPPLHPTPEEESTPTPAVAEPVAQEQQTAPEASQPPQEAATPSAEEVPPARVVPANIAEDVSQKLVSAGRPQEEAQAAGALLQAYYETRARRFGGAKGTAQELYAKEGPEIRGAEKGGRGGAATGKARIQDGKTTITLFRSANASTFIHETGHQWLEDLLSDAGQNAAPDQLKGDAGAVRQWLGNDGGDITTAQHEKFARGFERYMMEGVAPSRGLDRVFAQFKDWLTKIYETVKGLRVPITDDIRDVFDRFLSAAPEPATIAPEQPREFVSRETPQAGKNPAVAVTSDLADIHEADAEHAPAPQAAEQAEQVLAEREETEAQHGPAGIAPGGAGEEVGGGAVGRGPVTEPVSGPEPVSGSGNGVPEPATVGARGSQAAAEGNRPSKEPTSAAEPYSGPEPKYVDKAGNIRLELLTDDETARAALREEAERSGDFMDARRGVVSDAQVLDMADSINATAGQLNIDKLRQMSVDDDLPMAARIKAGRKMLLQAEAAVRQAAAEGNVEAFVQAGDRLNMIQATISGITAEWGRAGRAFRDMTAETAGARDIGAIVQEATGRTLFQIQKQMQQVKNLGTPGQVAKFARDAANPGLFDWVQSAFINALLSGPFTHAGYTVAGELYALFRGAVEGGVSAAVGAIREALHMGPEDRVHFGEVPHEMYGLYRGAINGAKASWAAFKANEPALPQEVMAAEELAPGTAPMGMHGVIPNPEIGGVRIPIGTILESPSRLVTALHTYNWTTFYNASKSQQAAHIAIEEGLTGPALANRIAALEQNPPLEIIQKAAEDASGGALMKKTPYSSLMGQVGRLTNYGWQFGDLPLPGGRSIPLGTLRPLKFIDPFVQIAANVQRAALGRGTPLALFSQSVRDDLMMRNGGEAFDRTAGKIIAGTGLMIGFGGLAAKGLMNGSGPSDPKQMSMWRRIYGQPHGLHVGDLTFNMLRLGPLGMQASVAADLYNVAHQLSTEDATKVAAEAVHAVSQNILDENFMRGPAELMQAVEDSNRYGAQWVRNFVSAAMPFSVGLGQVARVIDPDSRQARTTMDAIRAKIPFASEQLFPRYDVWGQPVPTAGWVGTYYDRPTNDPTDRALDKLGIYPGQPKRTIRGVQLTDAQYDEYARVRGRTMKMQLDALVKTPGFTSLPPLVQTQSIHAVTGEATAKAEALVMMHSYGTKDDIARKAIEAKRSQLVPGH